jgi:hypothetical protein
MLRFHPILPWSQRLVATHPLMAFKQRRQPFPGSGALVFLAP